MIRFLLRTLVFLGSAAIGLLVAGWLIPGVSVRPAGFIVAVVVWLVTAVATLVLPVLVFKRKVGSAE